MSKLGTIAEVLLVIGGLNWGLTAFGWNVVEMILGSMPVLVQIVYILVGLSALYKIVGMKKKSAPMM